MDGAEHRLRSKAGEETPCSFSVVLSKVPGGAKGSWVQGTDAQRTGIDVWAVEIDLVVEAI